MLMMTPLCCRCLLMPLSRAGAARAIARRDAALYMFHVFDDIFDG